MVVGPSLAVEVISTDKKFRAKIHLCRVPSSSLKSQSWDSHWIQGSWSEIYATVKYMSKLCFLLSSTHGTQFASGAANLSSLALYFHLQCLKVSPCVQPGQKLAEINEKCLEGISCAIWGPNFQLVWRHQSSRARSTHNYRWAEREQQKRSSCLKRSPC